MNGTFEHKQEFQTQHLSRKDEWGKTIIIQWNFVKLGKTQLKPIKLSKTQLKPSKTQFNPVKNNLTQYSWVKPSKTISKTW